MIEDDVDFGWPNDQDRGDSRCAFHCRSKLVEAMAGRSEDQRWREDCTGVAGVARLERISCDFWRRSG